MNTKNLIWIGIGSAALIATGLYLYNKSKKKEEPLEEAPPVEEPKADTTTTSAPAPKPSLGDGFPLRVGSKGERVKALQAALGIDADGAFGNITKGAVQKAGYSVPVSESDFNKIVNKKTEAKPNAEGWRNGDKVYLKKDFILVYNYPSTATKYQKGKIFKTDVLDKAFGTYVEKAGNTGFAKVRVFAYRTYDNKVIKTPTDMYVEGVFLSKNPF